MKPEHYHKLAEAKLTVEQIGVVMQIMAEAEEAMKVAEEARKSVARERVQRWRERLNLSSSEWEALKSRVLARDNYTCVYCGSSADYLHVDHATPLIQGGTNDLSNLVTACRECNCGKSGRTVEQWRGAL